MVKVILLTETGRKADLFPANAPIREALEQFGESGVFIVNGEPLGEEGPDSPLYRFARDAEVIITPAPEAEEETRDEPGPFPESSPAGRAKAALLQAKAAVEAALEALGEEELPF